MGDIVIEHSGTPHYEALNLQNVTTSENDADLVQSFCGDYLPEDITHEEKSTCTEALNRGYLEYGYVLCLIHDGKLKSILSNHSWLIFLHQFNLCLFCTIILG